MGCNYHNHQLTPTVVIATGPHKTRIINKSRHSWGPTSELLASIRFWKRRNHCLLCPPIPTDPLFLVPTEARVQTAIYRCMASYQWLDSEKSLPLATSSSISTLREAWAFWSFHSSQHVCSGTGKSQTLRVPGCKVGYVQRKVFSNTLPFPAPLGS